MTWKWHEHCASDELVGKWEIEGQEVICSECGMVCILAYDETYDPDTGDCWDYWFLIEK